VVGMSGSEGSILRRTIWPFLLYSTVVGIIVTFIVFTAAAGDF